MTSEGAERRAARAAQMGASPLPPVEHDPLPCPRCESTNTKFCYYNNYNFSQPRHFCKSCRRYWTQGGTLRDIPVGGGSRKTAKRSRTSAATPLAGSQPLLDPLPAAPVYVSLSPAASTAPTPINPVAPPGAGNSFTSLLSTAGPGILALGGCGFGLGLGLEDATGFGLGRGVWGFPEVGYVGNGVAGGAAVGMANGGGDGGEGGVNGGDTWQMETGGEGGFGVSGDCFSSLPELAISTPGSRLK